MPIAVRRLEPGDDRSAFHSGNVDLDRFFLRFAGQNQFRHHIGTSYVAIEESAILGFATVTPSELAVSAMPETQRRRLPKYPLPVLRLARLAVAESARGRGVGSMLMQAVFQIAHRLATDVGCTGVVVDAKPDAVTFYRGLGFEPLEGRSGELGDRPVPTPLFLVLGAIPKSKP